MLNVKVEGFDETQATLDRVQHAIREPKLPKAWKALATELRAYPPAPPGSRYIRTGHLGKSWRISFGQGRQATMFEATNSATYASLVQGDASEQAGVHRGRWTPASVILAKYENDIVDEWEAVIEQAAR